MAGKLIENQDLMRVSRLSLHEEVTQTLKAIYAKKNADYGNSFEESLEEYEEVFGPIGFVVRADDKMKRIKQLIKTKKAHVEDESFEDTVRDLANYCIMYLMYKERGAKNGQGGMGAVEGKEAGS